MGYQISRIQDIGQFVLKSDVLYGFAYIMLYRNGFELETFLDISLFKWDVSQPPLIFIAREIIHKFVIPFPVWIIPFSVL